MRGIRAIQIIVILAVVVLVVSGCLSSTPTEKGGVEVASSCVLVGKAYLDQMHSIYRCEFPGGLVCYLDDGFRQGGMDCNEF